MKSPNANVVASKPLSPDLLDKIDAYWRAANYLSVGQIYLYNLFNTGGTSLTLPSNLLQCGIGSANSNYINANKSDPTTGNKCACPAP